MDTSEILELLTSMGTILGVVFYLAIVLWTYKDARKRMDDPILIATATATSMLPVVGVLVYMLLRPSEYLADVRERELEIRMMERQLGRQERCPNCKSHIESDFLACPVCTTKLRQSCTTCERPLDPRWSMCPFCETEAPGMDRTPPPSRGGGRGARPVTPTASRGGRGSSSRGAVPKGASTDPGAKSSKSAKRPGRDSLSTEPFDGDAKSSRKTPAKSSK